MAEEKNVSWVSGKIGRTAANCKSRKQNNDLLPVVELNIAGQKVLAVKDSGAEICVFRKNLIPDKFMIGGHIYLIPAIGTKQKADLSNFPVAPWEDKGKTSSEIDILAAVAENLNCPARFFKKAHVLSTLSPEQRLARGGIQRYAPFLIFLFVTSYA